MLALACEAPAAYPPLCLLRLEQSSSQEVYLLKLKALYISSYVTFLMVASGYCIWRMIVGPSLPWLGALATTLPAALFFARAYVIGDVVRTTARLPGLVAIAVVGLAIGTGSYVAGSGDAPAALVVAAAGLISLITYSYWYSNLPRPQNTILQVGKSLPAFELETEAGDLIQSPSFLGKPLLMMFYRGNWCPLCMAQIREVAAKYRELAERGVEVALVSPQPHQHTRRLSAKFDIPFRFLVDPGNRAAKRLGLFAKDGLPFGLQALGYGTDTVWPTVVITDARGEILFADLTDNYRVRPEPSAFLEILDRLEEVEDIEDVKRLRTEPTRSLGEVVRDLLSL